MKTLTEAQVRELLRKKVAQAGGVRAFARQHDISAAYVSDGLLEKRNIGPSLQRLVGVRLLRLPRSFELC